VGSKTKTVPISGTVFILYGTNLLTIENYVTNAFPEKNAHPFPGCFIKFPFCVRGKEKSF